MSMSLEEDIEVLRHIPFFEGFSNEHLRLIAFSAESRSLPEKLLLYDEGQLLHSAYVVSSGRLRGERKLKSGGYEKREIGPGVLLGERALILDKRATESVRVEERARVLQIRKAMFRRLLQDYPEIALALRSRLMRQVVEAAGDFDEVGKRFKAPSEASEGGQRPL
jgi:CRP-like cAMP-binding protein